jgi:para-nitrobenzyl esterase
MTDVKQIQTTCGQGTLNGLKSDGVLTFFDIPYAENGGRFHEALAPRSWNGVRDCTKPGPIFPQLPGRLDFVQGSYEAGLALSEDAFRLNIFTPSLGEKLPVLFWIHGGGFISGSGGQRNYSGAALAKTGRAVVVTVNYRLGVLGNLYLPGVSPGNLSVRDLELSLRWVQQNIERFGGDPESIVLSGQSAGAWFTKLLIGMKETSAIARGAVMLSCPSIPPQSPEEAKESAKEFCTLAGIVDPIRELAVLPIEALLSAQGKLLASKAAFASIPAPTYPMQDERVPADMAQAAAIHFASKPVIIGWTREEASSFFASIPQLLNVSSDPVQAKFKEMFGVRGTVRFQETVKKRVLGTPYTAIVDLATDHYFKRASLSFARAFSRAGGNTFTFQFDYPSPQKNIAAGHCFDIPFWLGNFEDAKEGPMLAGIEAAPANALSALMQHYLLNFLHTGNPNHEALPTWKSCNNQELQTIHLGEYVSCYTEVMDGDN